MHCALSFSEVLNFEKGTSGQLRWQCYNTISSYVGYSFIEIWSTRRGKGWRELKKLKLLSVTDFRTPPQTGYQLNVIKCRFWWDCKAILIFLLSRRRKSVNRTITKCHSVDSSGSRVALAIRGLKQTTTARETRTWKNKRSNWPCVLKLCTFLSRPMQNNNLKSTQFTSSANRNCDGKLV